jgi:hypothetical protein
MTEKTAPPPHSKTVRLAVIGIVVAVFFGAIGLFAKMNGGNSGIIQGRTSLGPGSTGVNNGIQNFSFGAAATKADEDPGLFVDCFRGVRAAKFPADGRLYVVRLTGARGGDFDEMSGPPESDYSVGRDLAFGATRCEVTNYGATPLINVMYELHVIYRKAIAENGVFTSGDIVNEQDWPLHIGKIESGSKSLFGFYLQNVSGLSIEVVLPRTTVAHHLGAQEQINLKVATIENRPVFLSPFKD